MNTPTRTLIFCLALAAVPAVAQTPPPAPPPLANPPIKGPGYDDGFSPFGIGASSARSRQYAYATWIPQMAAIGIHEARTVGGTGYNGTGNHNWDVLDWQYNYLSSEGVRVGGIFYN